MTQRREKELRCFCHSKPLLATYGIDNKGKLFLHVKIYKQSRIFGEFVVEGGTVRLRCRNCLRWHVVVIKDQEAKLSELSAVDPVVNNVLAG